MRAAALPLLGLLAACAATPPAPAPEPPLSYPPSVRERLLRLAEGEWAEWGRRVAGPDGSVPGPGTGPEPRRRAEAEPEAFPRLLAYWRAVPEGEAVAARGRGRWAGAPGAPGAWGGTPWSAAFVSWLMAAAGVDRREFPPSAAHAFYLDALIADAERFPDRAPFVPREAWERAPAPGDLVCADRSRDPLPSWRARRAETGRFRPTHCDLVLRAGPGEVAAVGGNVSDAVTLTLYPADAAGLLLPRGPGLPVVFAVVENRLGRLPPFGPAPEGGEEIAERP